MRLHDNTTVAGIMQKVALEADVRDTVLEAAVNMTKKSVSSVVVTKNSRVIGIVTERDMTRRVVAKGIDPSKVKISKIMSKKLVLVKPDVTLDEAVETMKKKDIRHLPVVLEGTMLGILTAQDLMKIDPSYAEVLVRAMRKKRNR